MPTTKLNLPLIDGTNTADVVRDMNALANAVDNKAGVSDGLATLDASGKVPASQLNVSAPPDATTSTKGVVQLSNNTTSTSETLAATPKAVKDAKDGLSAQIGTLSGLNTTAKDNLVSAVNELFTFANDGKSKWSSVIGSPLVSSDTFAQMQTKTQTIKNTLATNLTAKGQSSTGTEMLTALVNKVSNIEVGPKYAAGQTTMTWNGSNWIATVTGLGFTPKTIIATSYQNGQNMATYESTLFVPKYGTPPFNQWVQGPGSSGGGTGSFYNITSTGFSCKMYAFSNGSGSEPFYWIAIG